MNAILLSFATFFSTCFGGLFALRFRNKLHLIMGFTAGVLIGVVCFDLLPAMFEAMEGLSHGMRESAFAMLVVGFLFFYLLEKLFLLLQARQGRQAAVGHHHPVIGVASALAFAGHSFLEGVEIGAGFQVSPTLGLLVAFAVILHDIGDGLNTMTLLLLNKLTRLQAFRLLLLVAVAPILGAASTLLIKIPEGQMPLYLGFLAGFLLYIGASHVLPEAHQEKSSIFTLVLTVLGAAFAYVVTILIG